MCWTSISQLVGGDPKVGHGTALIGSSLRAVDFKTYIEKTHKSIQSCQPLINLFFILQIECIVYVYINIFIHSFPYPFLPKLRVTGNPSQGS